MEYENIANIAALVFSAVAIITLLNAASSIGGRMGQTIKLLTAGIFMSVFCHAGFEMLVMLQIMEDTLLFPVMGGLLAFGSLIFVYSGYTAQKSATE